MKRYPRGTSCLGSWVQNAERVAVSPLAGFVTVCCLLEGSYSTLQTAKQRVGFAFLSLQRIKGVRTNKLQSTATVRLVLYGGRGAIERMWGDDRGQWTAVTFDKGRGVA